MENKPLISAKLKSEQYSENDKLQWKIRKLQVETENLSKPFFKQSATWLGIGALVVSLIGNLIQFSSQERKQLLAEIRKERLELEASKLEQRKQEIDVQIKASSFTAENMKVQLNTLRAGIASANVTKENLLAQIDRIKKTSEVITKTHHSKAPGVIDIPIDLGE